MRNLSQNIVNWLSKGNENPQIASNSDYQLLGIANHSKNVPPSELHNSSFDIYFIDAKTSWTEEEKNMVI